MIKINDLSFSYPEAETAAITSLSLELERGKIHCLLGANGSGKTTLLCLLAGLFNNFSGSLNVFGQILPSPKNANPNPGQEIRKFSAYVPQSPDVYLLGSNLEEDLYLGLPKALAQSPETKKQARLLLQELGLVGLEKQPLQTLSFGERRKACLASALLAQPQILLLDEPFAGLDWQASLHLRGLLANNKGLGITQIITVHDLDLLADLADNFVLLHKGSLLAEGEAKNVFPRLLQGNVRPPCWWLEGKKHPAFLDCP